MLSVRRHLFALLACFVLNLTCTAKLWAQPTYPSKPITIIVPFAPGGNLDVVTRLVATNMSMTLGQPIVVDNRSGAGGLIGHEAGARAQPDGHTLVTTANGSFAVAPKLVQKRSFQMSDFAPIGSIALTPLVLEVPASGRFKTFPEMLAYAKANPESVSIGHSGNGTTNHVAILLLEDAAGVKFNIVPYKGSSPAITDLLGGQIDAMVDQLPSSLSHIRAQKLRALALTTQEQSADLPGVSTVSQLGFKGFDVSTTSGLLAPAGTPSAIIKKINEALNKALANPDVQKRLKEIGADPKPRTPEQFQAFLAQEDVKAESLVKRGRLKGE